jgi:hypothetical protein
MIRRVAAAALVLFALSAVPARADFNAVARAIGKQHGIKRVYIPFLGLARFAVWVASPTGVHDFQLATFKGGRNADPSDLKALLQSKAGKGFVPLVQVWSKKRGGEWSFIYARPAKRGTRIELLVLARDDEDTTLVRVDVDAAVVAKHLEQSPRHVTRVAEAR